MELEDFEAEDKMPESKATAATWGEVPKVLCCLCGVAIDSNPSNMCLNCLRTSVDITEGIPKECTVTWCRACERYLQPPKFWTKADLESKELLTLCLKKVKGLSKVHLVDASWIWTEPHSRRLKIKITVQKEIFQGTVIEQSAVIDYVVHAIQCEICAKVATGQEMWGCVLQLRQRVEHKRMLLYLEQLILKHGMHLDVLKIQAEPDGIDFFFDSKSPALKLLQFVVALAPCKRVDAEQLISSDLKNNTANFHYSYRLDIARMCREDILCLPRSLYSQLGGIGPVVIVAKMFSNIVIVDPKTLAAKEITAATYWKTPFAPLATTRVLAEFLVMDVEIIPGAVNGKYQLADVTVCRESEVGARDFIVRSHLGNVLKPGDSVLGYDLETLNFNNDDIEKYPKDSIPSIVLVRKHYPNQAARRRKRKWALKMLPKIKPVNMHKGQENKDAAEMEDFMDELERDDEYRRAVALYRKPKKDDELTATTAADPNEARVGLEELLDGLEDENLDDVLDELDEEED
ncbi:60S ribosomal export protein NMD3 [Diplonema papillatum]|nr:60S ribosomal export protein NMD3 [Diplonema papillatum]|eukprot:gene6310-9669_t